MLKTEPSLTEEKNYFASYLVVVFTIFGFILNQNKKIKKNLCINVGSDVTTFKLVRVCHGFRIKIKKSRKIYALMLGVTSQLLN
jgi:hypothetical protein